MEVQKNEETIFPRTIKGEQMACELYERLRQQNARKLSMESTNKEIIVRATYYLTLEE